MISDILTDESRQILLFVEVPLLLLLAATITIFVRSRSRSIAKFPTFSVNLSRVGREDTYVVYIDKDKHIEFYAGPARGPQVHLLAPRDVSEEQVREIGPNLALGLTKLGFRQYSIRRDGNSEIIFSEVLPAKD